VSISLRTMPSEGLGNRHFVQTEEFGNPLSGPCAGKLSEQGRV
jgi:hypothetical protein